MNLNTILMDMSFNNQDIFHSEEKPYNLNIVGIRSKDKTPNVFNDELVVFWKDSDEFIEKRWVITTDPGLSGMLKPVNSKGVAILKPGQYKGVYKIDKHKGRYDALCQRGGTVSVYRDDDRDHEYDIDPNSVDTGWFGINIHGTREDAISTEVNGWSHGCQVFQNWDDFQEFMTICKEAAKNWGNSFTYTLIDEIEVKV